MRLLAFDTAGIGCSAGVFAAGRPLALRVAEDGPGHAERLPRLIEAVLAEASLELDDLDGLAVTVGPGSFSGIRTGLAAARGLALATGLRTMPVTTLEALAAPWHDRTTAALPLAAVLDARRGQVFLQRFAADGRPLDRPQALAPAAAAARLDGPVRLVGNGAAGLLPYLDQPVQHLGDGRLDAGGVALAAERALSRGGAAVGGFELHPCYARGADARPGAGRPLVDVGT